MSSAENIRETYFGGSDYVEQVARFNKPHVSISMKAGTPEDFTHRTGATQESKAGVASEGNLFASTISYERGVSQTKVRESYQSGE